MSFGTSLRPESAARLKSAMPAFSLFKSRRAVDNLSGLDRLQTVSELVRQGVLDF